MGRIVGAVRWVREHPLVQDCALAVGLGGGWAAVSLALRAVAPAPPTDPATVLVWSAAGVVPIALRRRAPWAAIAVLLALVATTVGYPVVWETASPAVLIVMYTTAGRMALRPALVAAGLLLVPPLAVPLVTPGPRSAIPVSIVIAVLLSLVSFFIGRFRFTRHAYMAALEARAVDAEANQRALADRAVAEERRRIARELHDVVAHQVSAMGVLATGARRTLGADPAAATDALEYIERTGRTTLRELRRLLDVLRADGEDARDELVPAPGLTAVRGLIDQVRTTTGMPVSVRVDGEPYPVDAGTGLTVYRLIQEALTNIVKHAGPASVRVGIEFSSAALTVEVFDTGRGPSGVDTGGHGLLGMRERVALYGGELRTGARPGGGFRVYARIPMDNLEGLSTPVTADIARGRAAQA